MESETYNLLPLYSGIQTPLENNLKSMKQSIKQKTSAFLLSNTMGLAIIANPFFVSSTNATIHQQDEQLPILQQKEQTEHYKTLFPTLTKEQTQISTMQSALSKLTNLKLDDIISSDLFSLPNSQLDLPTIPNANISSPNGAMNLPDIVSDKSNSIFIGDSIANGYATGQGMDTKYTKVGANPNKVTDFIKQAIKDNNNSLSGKVIYLSSGYSNNPVDGSISVISNEISLIKQAGGTVVLIGMAPKFKKQNDDLNKLATTHNIKFLGEIKNISKDGVHPANYKDFSFVTIQGSSNTPANLSANAQQDRQANLNGKVFATGNLYGTATTRNQLPVTERDVQAIARTVYTEIGNPSDKIGNRDKGQVWYSMATPIIDTILNRMIIKNGTAETIVNAKGQFSGINSSEYNRKLQKGNVMSLSESVLDKDVIPFTREYIKRRAGGKPSSVGGHVNYANPAVVEKYAKTGKASSNTLRWVREVASKGLTAGFKDLNWYHAHGTDGGIKNQAPNFKVIYKPSGGIGTPSILTKPIKSIIAKQTSSKVTNPYRKPMNNKQSLSFQTVNNADILALRNYDDDLLYAQFNSYLI